MESEAFDRDKVLRGCETGIIKRLPYGEFIEVHQALSQDQLHTLTADEQYQPAEIGSAVDENGMSRGMRRSDRRRAKLSEAYFGPDGQLPDRRGIRADHERPRPPLTTARPPRLPSG